MLIFAPGQGWMEVLPQLGWGASGGWLAVVVYALLVGVALFWRWRSRAWQRLSI
jgi:MATE family multidrug resistance protein